MEYQVQSYKDNHVIIQEKITFLYYQLCKKKSYENITFLSIEFGELLKKIKKCINIDKNYIIYLIYLYKIIAQTRDIENGKGERKLTYMLIYTLYKYYPVLAVYAIKIIVQPFLYQGNYFSSFGSWRDISGICEYINLCSPLGQYHPLIDTCIDILVDQLQKDYKILNKKIHYKSISLAAKWVPRENKKNNWLFFKIVLEWSKREWNFILSSAKTATQYSLALNKCCCKFRKIISALNRELDTIEIKLCSHKWKCIFPEKINTLTFIKKEKELLNSKKECSQNIKTFLYSKKYFDGWNDKRNDKNNLAIYGVPNEIKTDCYRIRNIPLYYYVKKAFQLINNGLDDSEEFHFLNAQWKYMLKYYNNITNAIPIINISMTLDDDNREPLYNAIGIACLISEKSSIQKRILFIHSNKSEWINLSNCENFISMIKVIKNTSYELFQKGNDSNIQECMQMILHTINNIKMSNFFIEKIVLVILQNNSYYNCHENIIKLFHNYEQPHFVYWNISNELTEYLPSGHNHPRITFFSGLNPSLVNFLSNMDIKIVRNFSPYDTILNILNNSRYNIMENIFMELVGNS